MGSLKSIIAATFLSASLLFPIKSFSEKEVVFDKTYSIPMTYEYGEKTEERINIKASLDYGTDTLYLGTYTENYNKKDWRGNKKATLPLSERHIGINHTFSRMFILRPSRVKIDEQEQRAYFVPEYEWDNELQPYERDERSQLLAETGDSAVDKIISKIPFLDKVYNKYIKDASQRETDYYDNLFKEIEADYARTRIFPYIPKNLIGHTETAREYTIKFDVGNSQDEIPMYVWLRIDLGNHSNAAYGSFPNKYGKLENILIKFTLNESNIKRDELYTYFLHNDELKDINVAKKNVPGTQSNPAVITISSLGYEERKPYEADNVIRIGIAEYIIQERGNSTEKDLSWGIVQFKTAEDRINFMERRQKDLKYPAFVKNNVLSYIESPTIDKLTSPLGNFSEEQYVIYADLILSYMNRTKMQVILDKDSARSKNLLKQIENYK